MGKKNLTLVLFILGFNFNLFSQNPEQLICNVKSANRNSPAVSISDLHNTYSYTGNPCVRVKIHKITKSGIPPLNDSSLQYRVSQLNNTFDIGINSSISFVADTQITEHDYDDVFSGDLISVDPNTNTLTANFNNVININSLNDQNAIDLYFSNNDLGGGSTSYEIANKTIAFISVYGINSKVIAHEIGHILGLFHTYHGTIGNGGTSGIPENQDGYGQHEPECASEFTGFANQGDYVVDTKGDAGPYAYAVFDGNCFTETSELINYCNNQGPDSGPQYPPVDLTNIMRSTSLSCPGTFTAGQLLRMIYFLNNGLSTIIAPNCVSNNDCVDCDQSQIIANQLFDDLVAGTPWNDCNYRLGYPTDLLCEVTFGIIWNNDAEVILEDPSDVAVKNFTVSGNQCLDIIVYLKDGTLCNTYNYCVEGVESTCGPVVNCSSTVCDTGSCVDCDSILQSIAGSLQVENTNCPIATLTIPNLDNCYTGQINWGDSYTWYDLPSGSTISNTITGGISSISIIINDLETGAQCGDWRSSGIPAWCRNKTNTIKLAPNPIKPNQELQFTGIDSKEITKIEILDMLGNPKQFTQRTPSSLFIGNLKPGIYFVKFYTAKGIEQKKLIIE